LDKATALSELVAKRRSETHAAYHHFHSFDQGIWDCEHVVPWTKSACNVHAGLMIIGQDWASERFLRNPKCNTPERISAINAAGQDEYLPTNRRLKLLLRTHFCMEFAQTYATNVLVFIKPGNMTGNVPMKDMLYCATTYTLPQLKIVQPVMAICLGAKTFNSLRRSLGLPELKLTEASAPSAHTVYNGTEIYGVSHTGGLGHANAGGMDNVDRIWAGLASRFLQL
jgi:uracil-DNA glycosylase